MTGALTVLMKDAIKPNLMQTLEVSDFLFMEIVDRVAFSGLFMHPRKSAFIANTSPQGASE